MDRKAVMEANVLDDGQSQSSTPVLAASALIYPEESLKDAGLIFLLDPDAGILAAEERGGQRDFDLAPDFVVEDRVGDDVAGQLVEILSRHANLHGLRIKLYGHVFLFGEYG